MTLVPPSDADPGPVPPTPATSSPPDFLTQLTAAQQADARLNSRGRELTDQEFLGAGQPNGTKGATPDLSHVSDADLQAIAAQGSSGATGGWSNAPMVHQWSNAPLARVKSRNFDDLARAFSPRGAGAPDLSSMSDEALRSFAGSSGTAAGGPSGPHLLSDADVGLTSLGTPTPVGPDVAKSAASGISSGVQGLIGMGGDIRHAAD